MTRKQATDFADHSDWLAYVEENVQPAEQHFALAVGRFELLLRFYEMRNFTMPVAFTEERRRIDTLHDPERIEMLEQLNGLVFARLTERLPHHKPETTRVDSALSPSPQFRATELLAHLRRKNPYFALWAVYKKGAADAWISEKWSDYLVRELGTESVDEYRFAVAMEELDRLLGFFLRPGATLPKLIYERIWFLHLLQGCERMLQTRAVLDTLAAEIEPCTSA